MLTTINQRNNIREINKRHKHRLKEEKSKTMPILTYYDNIIGNSLKINDKTK
jgi:hypothetical protein